MTSRERPGGTDTNHDSWPNDYTEGLVLNGDDGPGETRPPLLETGAKGEMDGEDNEWRRRQLRDQISDHEKRIADLEKIMRTQSFFQRFWFKEGQEAALRRLQESLANMRNELVKLQGEK